MSYEFTVNKTVSIFLVATDEGTLVAEDERTAIELSNKFNGCPYIEMSPIKYSRVANLESEMARLVWQPKK